MSNLTIVSAASSSTSLLLFELAMAVVFVVSGVLLRQRRRALQSQQSQRFQRLATTGAPSVAAANVPMAPMGVGSGGAGRASQPPLMSPANVALSAPGGKPSAAAAVSRPETPTPT